MRDEPHREASLRFGGRLSSFASERGMTAAPPAIAFALANRELRACSSARPSEQVVDNVQALELRPDEEALATSRDLAGG